MNDRFHGSGVGSQASWPLKISSFVAIIFRTLQTRKRRLSDAENRSQCSMPALSIRAYGAGGEKGALFRRGERWGTCRLISGCCEPLSPTS
jgi:hypothetical protein